MTIVVEDYDAAIEFFVETLGFELVEDLPAVGRDGQPKRWVVVRPIGEPTGIVLARPSTPDEEAVIGRQVAGRVGFFLQTDNFNEAHKRLVDAGVEFVRPPRIERYGRVAVFRDIAGNLWDLLGP